MSDKLEELNGIDLYRKYRPDSFDDLIGQDDAVKTLKAFIGKNSIPHVLLLTGPSGCGKTTTARILRKLLKCSKRDFHEINAAQSRGIDTVREVTSRSTVSAWGGKCMIWLFDESQKLSSDAQGGLLKLLEDTPSHVYFMLATTDPHKLLKTIRTRCTEVKFRSLASEELTTVIESVCKKENVVLTSDIVIALVESADGSARQALVNLGKIIHLPEEERLSVIQKELASRPAFDLVKALLWEGAKWDKVRKIISELDENEDWERLRQSIRTSASNEMLKPNSPKLARAFLILDETKNPYYTGGKAGRSDLLHDCFTIVGGK